MSAAVELRPVQAADLDWMEPLFNSATDQGDFSFAGFRGGGSLRKQFEENGCLADDHGRLIATLDGEAIGEVGWHAVHYGQPPASMAFNMGILMRPEARGQGHGTRSHELLVEYLFAHTLVNRIEASTDVENLAEQRALEKAGFTREGVARGSQFRNGSYHDMVVYSRLRSDSFADAPGAER